MTRQEEKEKNVVQPDYQYSINLIEKHFAELGKSYLYKVKYLWIYSKYFKQQTEL